MASMSSLAKLRNNFTTVPFLASLSFSIHHPSSFVHDVLALLKSTLDDISLPDEVNAAERASMFTRIIAVDGFGELSMHYVHQRSAAKGGIPLRSSMVVLPLLTAVSADRPSFHVVTPSLPGFALSGGMLENGFHAEHYAELETGAMLYIDTYHGFQIWSYTHQGVSLKYVHARLPNGTPARAHRLSVKICDLPRFHENPITPLEYLISSFTAREGQFFARTENFFQNCRGYSAEQATKPQTLGFSLADSPVGLLAWMYEKLVTPTDAYPWIDE
ncbi:alpha beta-hydrolase [Lactarius pseudohatsudake]|nr:alpha beta-hydrolase [Lactarius pseudohatsudake]